MRIAITLNEVFRDTLTQFYHVYEKYVAAADIPYEEITSEYYSSSFKFSNDENFMKFTYESTAVEIFGFAPQMNPELFEHTNEFLYDFDAKKNSITVVSKELNRSVPATFFWMSKVNSGFRNVELVEDYKTIWDKYDLVITASPEILDSKPEGKTSVKINAVYNTESEADYTFDDTNALFEENGVLNKIIKLKQ